MKFEYVNVVGEGCEGWINLFFGGWCVALIKEVELAEQIKAAIPEMSSVSDEQHEPHDNTCPACKGEGFGPLGERPSMPCGMCGTTGKI